MFFDCIVIGGGICGVSCVETISGLQPSAKILLVSASPLVKVASGFRQVTKTIEEFDVKEQPFSWIENQSAGLKVVHAGITRVNPEAQTVLLSNQETFGYKYLCVCTGGKPKLLSKNNPYVLGIRDTETVQEIQRRLKDARRVVIVGNGGIATELVSELEEIDVVWAIKNSSISATFVDPGAAEFFLDSWKARKHLPVTKENKASKRLKYTTSDASIPSDVCGSALGPDWAESILLSGKREKKSLFIEYNCEVRDILRPSETMELEDTEEWPIYVRLTNGKLYGCDFIVSATGVEPNIDCVQEVFSQNMLASDGGIKVNERMESALPNVYAAGDVCTASWNFAPHWFQMRLWTQARQMGAYAAKCISAKINQQEISLDFAFELFTHSTRFFGFKVILLGLFNGQKLGNNFEVLLRVTKGEEFVKVIVKDGKVQGAILVGETDLEETFENLILNGIDITAYGVDILNPNIDIEDYFD